MMIFNSEHKVTSSYDAVLEWLGTAHLNDDKNFISEFENMVKKAKGIKK
jgi:hypothetical protein